MWKSERCKTLSRLPLGFLGGGSGFGFGFANHPVKLSGDVGGNGHTPTKVLQKSYILRRINISLIDDPLKEKILTCPSYPAVSALAKTCVATLPSPNGPNVVLHPCIPTASHSAVIAAGPSSGAARDTILTKPRAAWHTPHESLTKGELGVSGWTRRSICLSAAASKALSETFGGKGCGSLVSF